MTNSTTRSNRTLTALAVGALVVAACGGADDASSSDSGSTASETTEAATSTIAEGTAAGAGTTETGSNDAPATTDEGFAALAPPTGETIVVGMVNTEGTPGLDFPEMRIDSELAVEYLNDHGGFGDRPIEIVHCTASGSPETSQACAQELVGKDVEMILLGLDLFPSYDTYAATGAQA